MEHAFNLSVAAIATLLPLLVVVTVLWRRDVKKGKLRLEHRKAVADGQIQGLANALEEIGVRNCKLLQGLSDERKLLEGLQGAYDDLKAASPEYMKAFVAKTLDGAEPLGADTWLEWSSARLTTLGRYPYDHYLFRHTRGESALGFDTGLRAHHTSITRYGQHRLGDKALVVQAWVVDVECTDDVHINDLLRTTTLVVEQYQAERFSVPLAYLSWTDTRLGARGVLKEPPKAFSWSNTRDLCVSLHVGDRDQEEAVEIMVRVIMVLRVDEEAQEAQEAADRLDEVLSKPVLATITNTADNDDCEGFGGFDV